MLVVWGCAAALPILERVGLVTGGFVVLGGEGGADLPGKKRQRLLSSGLELGGATFYC